MRRCGECDVCCTLTHIPELDCRAGVKCNHAHNGCGMYSERPDSCKKFSCEWLKGNLAEELRPDKQNLMLEKLPGVPVVLALLTKQNNGITQGMMDNIASQYHCNGISVLASNGLALIAEGHTDQIIKDFVTQAAEKMGIK